ncbi:MAG: hypothetical protein KJO07_10445 [Deltaproteobacteria bacterium]|nr:hypothetical protein [Deltaproteobacteria bacterium]
MANRGYKRSWKNLLINKDYQLRMTMVLVGVSALLMAGLGWWVMDQARTATEVAINNVEGQKCEKPAWMSAQPTRVVVDQITAMKPAGTDVPPVDEEKVQVPDPPKGDDGKKGAGGDDDKPAKPTDDDKPAGDEAKPSSGDDVKPAGDDDGEGEDDGEGDATAADGEGDKGERPKVTITDSSMDLNNADEGPAADAAAALATLDESEKQAQEQRYHDCELAKKTKVEDLRDGETLILQVLIGLGLLMVFGLAAYGIKMTHKVAGPLFKVSLYLRKLKDNKYDTVYNLRKGDHLVEFYDHFKEAHAGVRTMLDQDIETLKAALELAKAEKLADKSPELKASIEKLEKILQDREESIV